MKTLKYFQVFYRKKADIKIDKPTDICFANEADAFMYTLKKNEKTNTPFYFYKEVKKEVYSSLSECEKGLER